MNWLNKPVWGLGTSTIKELIVVISFFTIFTIIQMNGDTEWATPYLQ